MRMIMALHRAAAAHRLRPLTLCAALLSLSPAASPAASQLVEVERAQSAETAPAAPPSAGAAGDEVGAGAGQAAATLGDVPTAADLVRAALAHYRGSSSHATVRMVVHRPEWERSMRLAIWTAGSERSLVRVVDPPRDAGNATLLREGAMWSYAPKINRVIRIPASMMGQNWMGSDFSNRDVARSDDIVEHYSHRLVGSGEHAGLRVFEVESRPHPEAPVVWGLERLRIREDFVLLEHAFYDQQGTLVKRMQALEVREMGGRAVASVLRMGQVERPGEWTEMHTEAVRFDEPVDDALFTLTRLRNPQ